jgi:FKBP-type peptidyl-prolyl cis-trans isomerase FklB
MQGVYVGFRFENYYKMEEVSYALGLSIGNSLISNGVRELNHEAFAKGVVDFVEGGELRMSMEKAQAVITDFFQQLQASAGAESEKEGRAFLDENGKRLEVVTLESGLQYEVVVGGNGARPTASDTVKVHYHGTLIDGSVFDSSVRRGEPAQFGVTQVISGWVEALQLMTVGSKWKLFIPSHLAYGDQGAGQMIGPNTTLIFEVELLEII